MTREKVLTARFNNLLSLGLGIPALAYVIIALSTSLMPDSSAFIGLVVIGVVY